MSGPLRRWALRSRELMDDPAADPGAVIASLKDVAQANRLFGGVAAALQRLDEFFRREPPGAVLTLLDVGTGLGDIPRAAARRAAASGRRLRLLGIERSRAAARAASGGDLAAILADGSALPLRRRAVDLVLCSQVLHHTRGATQIKLLAELDRVARLGVVVADIRRSALAAAGIWVAASLLRFHPASRRDGVISVLRGFTPAELARVCAAAGLRASVRRHAGYRVTAAWEPAGASA